MAAAPITLGVALPAPLADEVSAFAEVEGGWEVVGAEGPPAPQLVVADRVRRSAPTVVVRDGPVDADTVRSALRDGAVDVLAWPEERQRLLDAPARLAQRHARPAPPTLRVAGVAGGVGVTTVALAVAGIVAWAGRDAVVVGGAAAAAYAGLGRWRGPGAPEVGALAPDDAAAEVATLARPVPGMPRLRLLGGLPAGGPAPTPPAGWPAQTVVIDHPDRSAATLLVGWCDTRLAAARDHDGALLLVGQGPLTPRQAAAVAGRAPVGWVPWSARVAEAAARGRVPAGLPGTWLRRLRHAVAQLPQPAQPPASPAVAPAEGRS